MRDADRMISTGYMRNGMSMEMRKTTRSYRLIPGPVGEWHSAALIQEGFSLSWAVSSIIINLGRHFLFIIIKDWQRELGCICIRTGRNSVVFLNLLIISFSFSTLLSGDL